MAPDESDDAPPAWAASEDPVALNRLMPVVYEELRALANLMLSDRGAHLTLQPTSLVHEAYLRLRDQRCVDWQDRLHFFRIAARAMRRVLVDHCRSRVAQKRGGELVAVEMGEGEGVAAEAPRLVDILMVDRLLTDLEAQDPQQARIVELRFFAGLTVEETAAALEISPATVKRDWAVAKAWLALGMGGGGEHGP